MDSSGKGVHKFHFGNVAVFDFVLTIIGAGIISYFTEIPISITIILSLLWDKQYNALVSPSIL